MSDESFLSDLSLYSYQETWLSVPVCQEAFAPICTIAPVNSKQKHRLKTGNHGCQTIFGEATAFNKFNLFKNYGKGTVLFLSVASRPFRFVSLHHLVTKKQMWNTKFFVYFFLEVVIRNEIYPGSLSSFQIAPFLRINKQITWIFALGFKWLADATK